MASNINANNIDGTYPIAGVDNDSQGFRTNFTNIKNNFAYAKGEIEDLQGKVILKGALSGGTVVNNDLSGTILAGAEIHNFRETQVDFGSTSGTLVLNHATAPYYTVTTNGSIILSFSNLPISGKLGRIRFKAVITSAAHTMTLPTAVNIGTDTLEGFNSSTHVLAFNAAGTYMFEFTTDDQGATIAVNDMSRPRYPTADSSDWSSTVPNFSRYSYANVGNNFSTTVTNTLYIDSVKILNYGNIYLPSAPGDGQLVTISSNNAIQTMRIISNTGVLVLGNVSTLSANANIKLQYVAGATPAPRWFKL